MATDSLAAELSPWTSTHTDTHLHCPPSVFPSPRSLDHQVSLLDRPVPDPPQHRAPPLPSHHSLSSSSSASSVERPVTQATSACSSFPVADRDNVSHTCIEDRDNHCGSCVEQRDNHSHSRVENRDNHSHLCVENRDNHAYVNAENRDNHSHLSVENRDNHSHSCTEHRGNHSHSRTEHKDIASTGQRLSSAERFSLKVVEDVAVARNAHVGEHNDDALQLTSSGCSTPVEVDSEYVLCTSDRTVLAPDILGKGDDEVLVPSSAFNEGIEDGGTRLPSKHCADSKQEFVSVYQPTSEILGDIQSGQAHQTHSEPRPQSHQTHSEPRPQSHQTHSEPRPQSHQTHSEPRPQSHQTHSEPRPQSHQTHSEPRPQSHQTHSEPRPQSHQTHSEPRPQSHQTHSEPRPQSHQTHSEPRPQSHQTHSEPRPQSHQTHSEPRPQSHQTHSEPRPQSHQTHSEPRPQSHQTHSEPRPQSHQTHSEPRPQSHQTHSEPRPQSHQTHSEPRPQSHQTHSEPRPQSHQTHSEPRPQSHQTHSEPRPQSHQTHSEPRPQSHQTHSEPRPQSHQTHSEPRPQSGQTHSEPRPQSHQTHSEPRPHSTPVWSCDFHDKTRNQALVKLSDDLRFYKMFYVLHSKCVNLGSRSFGPWCSKVTARRAKNGGVSPSKSRKDSPLGGSREKTVTDRLLQHGAGRTTSIRGKPRLHGGGRDIVNPTSDKNTKTTDVFDRLSGQGAPYAFQHFADVTQYMSEYREQHTVGRVCRRTKKVPVIGVDVPDPYTCRKKKTCTLRVVLDYDLTWLNRGLTRKECLCCDCSLLAKTKMAVSTRDGAAVDSESNPPGKDNPSSNKHVLTRAVPNLAPVREKKATDTGSHGTKVTTISDQQSAYVSRHSSSDHAPFPSLVLPTIHIQRDTKHMTLIGQSPPMENPLARSTEHTPSNSEESTGKPKHSDGDIGSSRKEGKKATARLKYSKRCAVPDSSVKMIGAQATPPDQSQAAPSAGSNPDNSAAHSEATSDKPSASKIQTGTAEASVCERELRLPRIVSKELAVEAGSKRGGRHNRSFYTTFTQAQTINANKHDPAGHGDRDAVSLGEGTRGAHFGNISGDLRSFGGNIRVYVRSKRSRSVEVFPRNRVRARKEAPHSSGNKSKKSDALSVRVMSEDDLTTQLRHEDTHVHHLADFRHQGDPLLRKVADSSLKLRPGPTDAENKVVFFLPDTEGQAIVGAKRTTKKDITLANSLTREKSKGINEPASQQPKHSNPSTTETSKQQKEFVSRTQREKSTYFNISQKNTVVSDSGNPTETIGIRGRTITENTSVSNGHGTNKTAHDKTFNSSDTIHKTPHADQDNEPETASPRFAGKFVGRQPTFVSPSDKYGVSTCTMKTGAWTSPASNVYRGSLLVQGGRLAGDLTTRTDQRDVETSATLPVKVEYRLPKDSAPPLDDTEHVTSVQA